VLVLAILLATAGMWLLLPRRSGSRTRPARWIGAVLLAAAVGLFFSRVPRVGDWAVDAVFFVLASLTIFAAVATVSVRNPIYAAIWFGMMLVGVAGLFLLQGSQFLAVATIVVYAGAILVTFLFLLMLSQPEGKAPYDRVGWEPMLSAAAGAVIIGVFTLVVASVANSDTKRPPTAIGEVAGVNIDERAAGVLTDDHVVRLGAELFGRHLIAVEVAGVLLLAALIGAAIIVAQTRRDENGERTE
jgi:NADH-quinone oxidoreductase subunit J